MQRNRSLSVCLSRAAEQSVSSLLMFLMFLLKLRRLILMLLKRTRVHVLWLKDNYVVPDGFLSAVVSTMGSDGVSEREEDCTTRVTVTKLLTLLNVSCNGSFLCSSV